ncbi:Mitochondrial inner membrane magnesium transporter LPE10 [Neolecta irregularis DAH-3]|uniref:Magnesium transporter n=1 Tax=Neolecta irregularis (strain DAH-3) TaxID=1198029 RepID=A0A1U7LTH9_NEOID|nr:Mitochondrial inner membrane magnesium transporter LPE10 [Neolecta irregularis DAH-3]|eukprot:OLL25918.1 Mitochondrial inner membrane magnesium transporter LPE10 [Neolecta irregularis DAH-3]
MSTLSRSVYSPVLRALVFSRGLSSRPRATTLVSPFFQGTKRHTSETCSIGLSKLKQKKKALPLHHEPVLKRSAIPNHKSNDLLVRCTEFDCQGNVRVVSGEFKKSELCTQHGLLPRDLRKLAPGINVFLPSILVRKNSILINLLHIRTLVKADLVLVFDIYGSIDSHTQSVFMYDLEGKLRQGSKAMGGLPYELRAVEAVLISVTTALNAEMKILQSLVTTLLSDLEEHIDRDNLRRLLVYSKNLSAFEKKATLVRDTLDEILESDEDLVGMYLSEKRRGKERSLDQHDEVELLLEAYLQQTDEIVQIVDNLVSNIKSTEEIVNIILDANRNSLMLLDLKVSMGTLGIGSGALVAGLFGMNLHTGLEESLFVFQYVSVFAFILTVGVCAYGLQRLRKVQRVKMWNEQ